MEGLMPKKVVIVNKPKDRDIPLIFISYDTKDYELILDIDRLLKRIFSNRIDTFIAKRDIKPGDDAFRTMLHENLSESVVVLAICTKRSATSPWLWFEAGAGFRGKGLIPVWVEVEPTTDIKAPMTIFQGKHLNDKEHITELMIEIANRTGVTCSDYSLTEEEFENLQGTITKLEHAKLDGKKPRIEDKIKYPLPTPGGEIPVQYLIEASFPLDKPEALQNLMDAINDSKLHINGVLYPHIDKQDRDKHSNIVLRSDTQQPYSNEIRQTLIIKSDNVTLTHWMRHFRLNKKNPRFIKAIEFIDEGSRLFVFFRRVALKLNLTKIKIRIKLFDLQNGSLHVDSQLLSPAYQSYIAPESGEIEVEQEITLNVLNEAAQEFVELLKHIWQEFRTPNGVFARLDGEKIVKFIKDL
jgi:hypothetical protein